MLSLFGNFTTKSALSGIKDINRLWALILTHGGQFSRELRGLTTHLICGRKSGGLKFEKATTKKDTLSVVTPDFVTQCIREKRLLPVDSFHPRLLVTPGDPIEAPERKKIHKKKLFNDTDATTAQQVPIQVSLLVLQFF